MEWGNAVFMCGMAAWIITVEIRLAMLWRRLDREAREASWTNATVARLEKLNAPPMP